METQAVGVWPNICSPKKKFLNGQIGFEGSLNHVSNLFSSDVRGRRPHHQEAGHRGTGELELVLDAEGETGVTV